MAYRIFKWCLICNFLSYLMEVFYQMCFVLIVAPLADGVARLSFLRE